jgi:hypothetical protein
MEARDKFSFLVAVCLFFCFVCAPAQSQEPTSSAPKVAQSPGPASPPPPDRLYYAARAAVVNPDQGKMGVYRSLAELTFDAYEDKKDSEAAALARILEKVWDRGETDLRKSSPDTWSKIDRSMDAFIKPLIATQVGIGAAEPKVMKAYQQYLDALATAD